MSQHILRPWGLLCRKAIISHSEAAGQDYSKGRAEMRDVWKLGLTPCPVLGTQRTMIPPVQVDLMCPLCAQESRSLLQLQGTFLPTSPKL